MRTYTVTKREGELLGPIDWDYDFRSHFNNYCTSEENKDAYCEKAKALLRQVEELHQSGTPVEVAMGDYWRTLYDIGMYDGWPYWQPTPALFFSCSLGGGEWGFFYELRDFRCAAEKT